MCFTVELEVLVRFLSLLSYIHSVDERSYYVLLGVRICSKKPLGHRNTDDPEVFLPMVAVSLVNF